MSPEPVNATRRRRRGAQAVEFALIMPVFLAVLGGIIEYGWYFHREALVSNAVRRAARTAAATPEGGSPVSEATTTLDEVLASNGMSGDGHTIEIRGTSPDQVIFVNAVVEYQPLIGLVPIPAQHNSAVGMRLEVQDR